MTEKEKTPVKSAEEIIEQFKNSPICTEKDFALTSGECVKAMEQYAAQYKERINFLESECERLADQVNQDFEKIIAFDNIKNQLEAKDKVIAMFIYALQVNSDYKTMRDIDFRKKYLISAGVNSTEYVASQTIKAITKYEESIKNK